MATLVHGIIDGLIAFATDLLIPFMCLLFVGSVAMRILVSYTVRRQEWFAKEFQKRVDQLVESDDFKNKSYSFYKVTKKILEKTYYELFEVRSFMKRRNPDFIMAFSDRVFMIQQGVAWFVRDILKQLKFLPYEKQSHPKIFEISKSTFQRNPCFNKVFGILPAATATELLGMLPGIFIVLGILGTFLGIMKALPDLGNMDLADIEGTKLVMDQFLLKISFSMSTSLMGIILSVSMGFINAFFSPNKAFVDAVERMEVSLYTLWNISGDNDLDSRGLRDFDEHKDPMEALAEQAIEKQVDKTKRSDKRAA